jgi:hypothetical protein
MPQSVQGGIFRARDLSRAHHYATQCARIGRERWFVCKRNGQWYAIAPELRDVVERNPNWPGVKAP